jgi:hypothetical protein
VLEHHLAVVRARLGHVVEGLGAADAPRARIDVGAAVAAVEGAGLGKLDARDLADEFLWSLENVALEGGT